METIFSNACGCTEFWCVCHAAEWAEIKEIYWKFSTENQLTIKSKIHGNDSKEWSINFTGTCWESLLAVNFSCALEYQTLMVSGSLGVCDPTSNKTFQCRRVGFVNPARGHTFPFAAYFFSCLQCWNFDFQSEKSRRFFPYDTKK